jgi:hypothetical protein
LFGFALTFFRFCRYPPFFDDNPFGIYEKILAGKIQFPSHFDANAKDLVKKLLTADRTKRIGNLKSGAEDIKQHKWFKGINFQEVWDLKMEVRHTPVSLSSQNLESQKQNNNDDNK